MSIFRNFNKPTYATTEELLAYEGKKRTDWIVGEFAKDLEERMLIIGKDKMTEEELVVLAVEALEDKVNNDGYHGYFTHSTKEFVPIIIDSLKRIKANEVAELTEQAIQRLGIKGTITEEKVEKVIEERYKELIDELGEYDTKYFQMKVDLADKVLVYIKDHKEKIHIK